MKFSDIQKKAEQEWEKFAGLKRPRILVGAVTCGRAAGAIAVKAAFKNALKANKIKADVYDVGCLGMCYAEPVVEIGLPDGRRILYHDVTAESAERLVKDFIVGGKPCADIAYASFGEVAVKGVSPIHELPMFSKQVRIVLANAGLIDPTNIYHYVANDGYSGLVKALGMKPEDVIEQVKASGLKGRGGAGFSTGMKWQFARNPEADQKYVICNADEGDPGAFMDRSVLESDPHAVLEGLTVAGYAIGASLGYIYARAEYPLAIERLTIAIEQMKELRLLGRNIMGSGFNFEIKIKEGAGAFVCGEETALIASIEGERGMPRSRPPFPAISGVNGKPTNINNVETLANIPRIMVKGAEWYSSYGTENSAGTKTFALAGKINRTGLIEVPMGIKLSDIIYEIGGGIPDNKKFKAVQTGGPSGGCLPAELLNLKVDYQELAKAGSIMGSGGMIVMDEESCMVDIAKYFLEFTHHESCGKCVPCRMGSQHLLRMLKEITSGQGSPDMLNQLEQLAETIKSGSLCGLGQTIPNSILSTIQYFRKELEDHLVKKQCEAMVCKGIISSPCQYTCPIGQDVPTYIAHIANENFDRAIEIIRRENPFPGICGRVCPHECEKNCEAGKHDKPISIRSLKRFAADYEMKKGLMPEMAEVKYEEKIAIIGAGPAGLAAAWFLTQEGYECTVYEKLDVAGGMLAVGIPDYRLPESILKYEIDYIKKAGVTIKTGMSLGSDFSIESLKAEGYKAIFVATGAHQATPLRIEGEENRAVIPGVSFLRDINLGKEVKIGNRIAVIGGGNVAVDSARAARRMGSEDVFILYRRTQEEMPAHMEEIQQLKDEKIPVEFLAAPVKVVELNGRFQGIECVKMELAEPDSSGRRRPVPIQGSEYTLECDNVISAIGQRSELDGIDDTGIDISRWDTIDADLELFSTSMEGVFAGGDVVSGPDTVINAIAHGKTAARSIGQYLQGQEIKAEYAPVCPAECIAPVELTDDEATSLARPKMPCVAGKKRVDSFIEVEKGFTSKMAVVEAKRCLRCDSE